jgi:TetR/AcrR family transcriptional regulator, transcriptional repressor for nem operon
MARPRSEAREELVLSAMRAFWKRGFVSITIEDLVKATGVGRGGIYGDFRNKEGLLLGCLQAYRDKYVDPALAILDSEKDGLSAIDAYFTHFIDLHKQHGMPGPGCFFANAMTELAPHDEAVWTIVAKHMADLRKAFRGAVERAEISGGVNLTGGERDEIAGFLATTSQGLWSYGRSITDIRELESFKHVLIQLLKTRLGISSSG